MSVGGGKSGSNQQSSERGSSYGAGTETGFSRTGGGATSQVAPWAAAEGNLRHALSSGRSLYGKAVDGSLFPDQMVTPFAPQSRQSFAAREGAARTGQPVVDQAARTTTELLAGGGALENIGRGNPHRDAMLDIGLERLADRVRGQYAGSGVAGSAAFERNLGNTLGDYTTNFLHNAYETDRGHDQAKAALQAGLAPQAGYVAQNTAIPGTILRGVGSEIEAKGQQGIDAEIRRNLLPVEMLAQYGNQAQSAAQAFGSNRTSYDQQTQRQAQNTWNRIQDLIRKSRSRNANLEFSGFTPFPAG